MGNNNSVNNKYKNWSSSSKIGNSKDILFKYINLLGYPNNDYKNDNYAIWFSPSLKKYINLSYLHCLLITNVFYNVDNPYNMLFSYKISLDDFIIDKLTKQCPNFSYNSDKKLATIGCNNENYALAFFLTLIYLDNHTIYMDDINNQIKVFIQNLNNDLNNDLNTYIYKLINYKKNEQKGGKLDKEFDKEFSEFLNDLNKKSDDDKDLDLSSNDEIITEDLTISESDEFDDSDEYDENSYNFDKTSSEFYNSV